MAAAAVVTPEKKQNFDWIYVQENPCAYKTNILDGRNYICDNHTRGEFNRLILPNVERLVAQRAADDNKVRITDLGCCFGNTTLALVHGMETCQIADNWKDEKSCEKIQQPRRIPSMVTGIDISEPAVKYCKRTGIVDEAIVADCNSEAGLQKCKMAVRGSDILISAATLVYLDLTSVEYIVENFAAGLGEGYAIVNFLNPFEPEKTDKMKQVLLKHLDFVGSRATQHRTMSDLEKSNYPDYGDWALLEVWTLKRRANNGQMASPKLPFSPEPRNVDAAEMRLDGISPPASPVKRSISYKDLPVDTASLKVKDALVVAAAQLSSLDSLSGPKCLIRLGQLPIICHILSQLQHAGVERVVLLCGFKGEKVAETVERDLPADIKSALKIEYVQAGESWHRGCAYSVLEAKKSFKTGQHFLMCMADHIFDPKIISRVCNTVLKPDEGAALVEKDFKGMVGMAPSATKVQLADTRVANLGRSIDLAEADGVDAGLFVVGCEFFDKLGQCASTQAYFALSDVLNTYTTDKKLRAITTDGEMWFAVETKEAIAFAVADGLKQMGTVAEDEGWLSDGAFDQDGKRIPISISGKGKSLQPGGSKWEEFTVERWRSAVYINLSYFAELNEVVKDFIVDIAKNIKLRGQRVSMVEVGCGTGEFIRPIADHFRLAVGLDFNQNFIDFCNDNIPKGKEHKQQYICGDACDLVEVVKKECPAHVMTDTKIVTCVGNTIGIIPVNLKERVYRQMTALAGEDGVIVVVYWNARSFGDACQNFYHANPQLCGPFTGESINFDTTTLTTPAPWNYRSHWTGIEEARQILKELDLEEIIVEERGKGVLVAARANKKTD